MWQRCLLEPKGAVIFVCVVFTLLVFSLAFYLLFLNSIGIFWKTQNSNKMERWFQSETHDSDLPRMEYDQIKLIPETLSMTSDFSHCLGEKLPLELLATDDEVVSNSIIELEVQMDEKCFSDSHEESAVLSEETILFEEVRDVLHGEDRDGIVSIQSKVVDIADIIEEKIMLLTPHELESMKVNPLESDSEKEGAKTEIKSMKLCDLTRDNPPVPLTVLYDNKALYVCPVEGCSKGYPNLCMVNNHIVSHDDVKQLKNVRQFKVNPIFECFDKAET